MGPTRRTHRRLMHHAAHPSAAKKFHPHQLKSARRLLRNILDHPDDIMGNIRQYVNYWKPIFSLVLKSSLFDVSLSAESVLAAAYGFEVESKFNKYISLAAAAVDPLAEAMLPGTFLVDMLPMLKHIPDWFPGASFKRKAKQWRLKTLELRDRPFEDMKRKLVSACIHRVVHWELSQILLSRRWEKAGRRFVR